MIEELNEKIQTLQDNHVDMQALEEKLNELKSQGSVYAGGVSEVGLGA